MKPLAVIAGIGGINAAGRSSAHHGYRRSVIDVLDHDLATGTLRSLAGLMGIEGAIDAGRHRYILEHTLVRGLEPGFLDPGNVAWNCRARLVPGHGPVSFIVSQRDLAGGVAYLMNAEGGFLTLDALLKERADRLAKKAQAAAEWAARYGPRKAPQSA